MIWFWGRLAGDERKEKWRRWISSWRLWLMTQISKSYWKKILVRIQLLQLEESNRRKGWILRKRTRKKLTTGNSKLVKRSSNFAVLVKVGRNKKLMQFTCEKAIGFLRRRKTMKTLQVLREPRMNWRMKNLSNTIWNFEVALWALLRVINVRVWEVEVVESMLESVESSFFPLKTREKWTFHNFPKLSTTSHTQTFFTLTHYIWRL